MANSDRKIIRGVQIGTTTYLAGQENELDGAISSSEVERLKAKGYLEGDWKGKAAPAQSEAPSKGTEPAQDEGGSSEDVDLSTLKKDELLTRAESLGVEANASMTKAEIVEAIESHKEK